MHWTDGRVPKQFECKQCGSTFASYQAKAHYCSKQCLSEYKRRILAGKRKAVRPIAECLCCKQPFEVPRPGGAQLRSGAKQIYCSRSCASKVQAVPRVEAATRKREAERKRNAAIRLAAKAADVALHNAQREAAEADHIRAYTRTCEVCGQSFVARRAGRRQIACRACGTKREKAIRQVWKRGNKGERVSPWAVFKRDNYTCWICGEPTSLKYDHADLRSPTMDHVIPLSRGGHHAYDNIRCAHAICNSIKSDSIAA